MDQIKKCFGTKEYSDKSRICKNCKLRIECKKKCPSKKTEITYIQKSDYRVWQN